MHRNEVVAKAAEQVRKAVEGEPEPEPRPDRSCKCGPYVGWDEDCRDRLHKQIWDRPMGMTD